MTQQVTYDFRGQVAIVTGGTRGLGLVVAERLALAGCMVAVCGRNAPSYLPAGIAFYQADVRDAEQAKAFVDNVAQKFGRVDILVNNAGGGQLLRLKAPVRGSLMLS